MVAALSVLAVCAALVVDEPAVDAPPAPLDPSEAAPLVESAPGPPPPPLEPSGAVDPVEPEPVPVPPPEPDVAPPPPASTRVKQAPPAVDPPRGANNPATIGLGATLGGCAAGLGTGIAAGVVPFAACAFPFTTIGGVVAGTAIASGIDGGEIDHPPLFLAGGLSVLAAGVVGAGLGAGFTALTCRDTNDLSGCGFIVPLAAVAGGVLGTGLAGPIAAGVVVAVLSAPSS